MCDNRDPEPTSIAGCAEVTNGRDKEAFHFVEDNSGLA